MAAGMLVSRAQMAAYSAARHALAEADQAFCADTLASNEAFAGSASGHRHAVIVAAVQWLAQFFDNSGCVSEVAVVSSTPLRLERPKPDDSVITSIHGTPVICRLQAERTGNGAGGRPVVDDKVLPVIQKKGPDSWRVTAQVENGLSDCRDGIGMHRSALCVQVSIPGVKLDVYWRIGDPAKHYNRFSITECSDLQGFQQWCASAVSTAASLWPATPTSAPSLDHAASASGTGAIALQYTAPEEQDELEDLVLMLREAMPPPSLDNPENPDLWMSERTPVSGPAAIPAVASMSASATGVVSASALASALDAVSASTSAATSISASISGSKRVRTDSCNLDSDQPQVHMKGLLLLHLVCGPASV